MDRDDRSESFNDGLVETSGEHPADGYSRRRGDRRPAAPIDKPTPLDDFDALLKSRAQPNISDSLRSSLDIYLRANFSPELTERATSLLYRQQPQMSARLPMLRWHRVALSVLSVAVLSGSVLAPSFTALVILSVIFAYCVASMALKAALTLASIGSLSDESAPASGETPIVTILLPVNKEGMALVSLVAELERLDYPTDRLDLKFLVEDDDPATREALELLNLPSQFEILSIPKSHPQTKPKAMNYALPFVRGEIVGIYDAEDQPEADQVRKAVDALAAADARTVCVQCRLNHYDATETYFSRMASIEYTLWFDMLLRGLSRLKLPVPLGGTSLFIETRALKEIDGWDPFNVTEDADLGLRLARRGWRAQVIDSTTWEEPPIGFKQWSGQRSRWIKGFMVTWLVHMRRPRALFRELGWRNALAINIMLLDGFVAFLLQPLFWIAIVLFLAGDGAPWSSLLQPSLAAGIAWTFGIGQAFILVATFVAVRRRFGVRRAIWTPLIWLYWQCATVPAYRALREMFGQQADWNKTEHGLSKSARKRRDEAMRKR